MFHHFLALRRRAPALSFALGVSLGQGVVWFLSDLATELCLFGLGVSLLIRSSRIQASVREVGVGIVLGVVTAMLGARTHPPPWGATDAQVLVRVQEQPSHRIPGEGVFIGEEVLGSLQRTVRVRAVDLPWRHASHLSRGDVVWVRGAIVPVARPRNPLSWEASLWRRGVSGEMKALFVSVPAHRERSTIEFAREAIRSTVTRATHDSRGGALFLSMALGERDVLSAYVESSFKAVGMSHLLVVSGYQVSLVFGVIFGVCMQIRRVCGARLVFKNLATVVALMCGGAYVALVGGESSSVRALIAATCLCVALVIDRPHRFAQRWATALLVMQLVYPWAIFDLGVLLTFAALGGIGLGGVLGGESRIKASLWVTVCVWLLTSTVMLAWNGALSISGVVLNLFLAAPWSMWNCVVGGLSLVVAMVAPVDATFLIRLVAGVNEWIASLVLWVANVGGPSQPLEGAARGVGVVAMSALIAVVGYVALRRHQSAMMREMVTPRYKRS